MFVPLCDAQSNNKIALSWKYLTMTMIIFKYLMQKAIVNYDHDNI